ncbi:tRNA (adenine-N(1)-)-methyltransferase catalytic subunit trm61 [Mycoemilia scoparia]|uniref:tRNA (adenine(58)-N(1))-methyltransferase catalytic subunit TRM61 n=1 Tax=Mycoemilia scoparia TaxID=417184 RepID=A0A9W7ZSS2_9FUNG|nr:tRNA (adenine-N(1)-)-methyltransferase catalytic subunit trm61 [Mycoemilia scoparia]
MSSTVIQKDRTYNTRNGVYHHNQMVGLSYGQKMKATSGKGTMYLLHPTPELWTKVLPHRTQILYLPDISFISMWLDLVPGKKVIETGTGSGSFSHSIARNISPDGHLYTYEYHEQRFEKAKAEFEAHGLSNIVTSKHRDVIANGFDIENYVDAIFLDLPAPWEVIGASKKAFNKGVVGRICSFSPCIEQVQRTVLALNEHGFTGIRMYECLVRDFEAQHIPLPDISTAMDGAKVKFKKLQFEQKLAHKRKRLDTDSISTATTGNNSDASNSTNNGSSSYYRYSLASKCGQCETRGHTSYLTFAELVPILESTTVAVSGEKEEEAKIQV